MLDGYVSRFIQCDSGKLISDKFHKRVFDHSTIMYKLSFYVAGMHCDSCVKLITMKMKKIDGVSEFSITRDGKAELSANREVGLSEVKSVLQGMEYTVTAA